MHDSEHLAGIFSRCEILRVENELVLLIREVAARPVLLLACHHQQQTASLMRGCLLGVTQGSITPAHEA